MSARGKRNVISVYFIIVWVTDPQHAEESYWVVWYFSSFITVSSYNTHTHTHCRTTTLCINVSSNKTTLQHLSSINKSSFNLKQPKTKHFFHTALFLVPNAWFFKYVGFFHTNVRLFFSNSYACSILHAFTWTSRREAEESIAKPLMIGSNTQTMGSSALIPPKMWVNM